LSEATSQATFNINLGGDMAARSKDVATAQEQLRHSIRGAQDQVKLYSEAMRGLKGSSNEVKAAKEQLKAKIDGLTQSVGKSKLELLKMGTTYEQLQRQSKAAAARQNEMTNALKAAGGPLEDVRGKLSQLQELFGGEAGAAALAAGATALVVAAVVALSAAALAGVVAFARWAVETANQVRTLGLLQEAVAGSAQNSAAMTSQIDAMARKVPTARVELQRMYEDLYTLTNHTRMSGQAIQSTYEAIAQSSAAMGGTAGKAIGDLITRSAQLGIVRIGRLDVAGTGLDYEKDLVAPLAKSMAKADHVTAEGMAKARAQLAIGGLQLEAGAKLVADAVNNRFGAINLKLLGDLDAQWKRLKETFTSFTRGINLEPLINAVSHFLAMFNEENSVGAALKQLVELLGNGIVDAAGKSGPAAENLFKSAVILAQDVVIAFLEVRNGVRDAFHIDISDFITDLKIVKEICLSLVQMVPIVGQAVTTIRAGLAVKDFAGAAAGAVGGAVSSAGAAVGSAAGSALGALDVRQSPAHAEGGVVGMPAPGEFWASVAPGETIVPRGGVTGGGGGSPVSVNLGGVAIHAGGKSAHEIETVVASSSFQQQLQYAFETILLAAGIQIDPEPA
jgi:hypothetical protein